MWADIIAHLKVARVSATTAGVTRTLIGLSLAITPFSLREKKNLLGNREAHRRTELSVMSSSTDRYNPARASSPMELIRKQHNPLVSRVIPCVHTPRTQRQLNKKKKKRNHNNEITVLLLMHIHTKTYSPERDYWPMFFYFVKDFCLKRNNP